MNRRQKKKTEKIRRGKLHRILDQVLDINGMEARTRELTGDKPTAFLYINGHIGTASVSIDYSGWHPDKSDDFRAEFGLKHIVYLDSIDDVIKQMDYIRRRYRV